MLATVTYHTRAQLVLLCCARFACPSLPRALMSSSCLRSSFTDPHPVCQRSGVVRQTTNVGAPSDGDRSETPESVLRFWFGDEFLSGEACELNSTNSKEYYVSRKKLWYGGGVILDAEIRDRFGAYIRQAAAESRRRNMRPEHSPDGHKREHAASMWSSGDVDGMLARVILFDQLSRNAFRGTAEAYAYDDEAACIARAALQREAGLSLPPVGVIALAKPLMHSEAADDHVLLQAVIERLRNQTPECYALQGFAKAEEQHAAVIRRFGRYPHRNAFLGRTSTDEEVAWLASPARPGWAR